MTRTVGTAPVTPVCLTTTIETVGQGKRQLKIYNMKDDSCGTDSKTLNEFMC